VIASVCRVRGRFGWLLAVVVVGCGLAACTSGGGHDPTPTAPQSTYQPSTHATATPTPTNPRTTGAGVSPGEKPPVLRQIANEHTRIGALEFAVYYIKALDWGTATADPFLLEQISAPTCKSCKISIDAMRNLEAEGGKVEGGRYKIESVETLDGTGSVKADYAIKFVLTQDPIVVVHPTATNTVTTKRETFVSEVYISWVRGRWLVMERKGMRS
jgi:hypothetical protein